MFKLPLWVAKGKSRILVYDSEYNMVLNYDYTSINESRLMELVNLANKHQDLTFIQSL